MSIFKINKTTNFTVIHNSVIDNEDLSWKARGILIYLLSKPNNWEVRMSELISKSKNEGQMAVRSALKELVKFGYARLVKGYNHETKKPGSRYEIFESPIDTGIE